MCTDTEAAISQNPSHSELNIQLFLEGFGVFSDGDAQLGSKKEEKIKIKNSSEKNF